MDNTDRFKHQKIDRKWQRRWANQRRYRTPVSKKNTNAYVLDMFPYPSGEGLHVGHPLGYIGSDILARHLRARGRALLHPMGFDSFGLPAENYAVKTGIHPAKTTKKQIDRYRQQLQIIGLSYDWEREIITSDPTYYRWTQWLFLHLFRRGLAYRAKAPVNWCPRCQTVLANEQVVTRRIANSDKRLEERTDNFCERCDTPVVQKELEQWFFKITDYADELLTEIDKLDWPEPIKLMQRHWIGRSEGALIRFQVTGDSGQEIEVFTTRPDTLFGATYLVLAPEHQLLKQWLATNDQRIANRDESEKYIISTRRKTELERTSEDSKEKTGVELKGITAINPATKEKIPIWVADYVLASYGTGAIMAVPAHDQRDFEFARQFRLPVKIVVEAEPIRSQKSEVRSRNDESKSKNIAAAYEGDGILTNSRLWNGWHSKRDRAIILDWIEDQKIGRRNTTYRLRDWLISRQRYWGAPIPVIYCDKCPERLANSDKRLGFQMTEIDGKRYAIHPAPEDQLPILLPTDVDFKPTGQSPLVDSQIFHEGVTCPKCGAGARREVDTMDTFVDSSWYFLRYTDPHNDHTAFDPKKMAVWLPVDWYIGGAEHAVLHLLYARFITKALADLGLLKFREPFLRLRNQGLISGEDGRKMSKRWGNVVNPDDVIRDYGADAFRAFEMFMGPFEEAKPWSTPGIVGVRRWLDRVWRMARRSEIGDRRSEKNSDLERLVHQTIAKVTKDIENFHFNTAVSQLMILSNALEKKPTIGRPTWRNFLQLLAPFVPHLAHELWERAGFSGYPDEAWPAVDRKKMTCATVTLAIQVNGKLRGQIDVPSDAAEDTVRGAATQVASVAKHLSGKTIRKTIIVPGRIVNFVVS